MRLVHSTLIIGAGVLVAAISITAQGPPAPSPSAMSTSRTWSDEDLDRIMKQVGPARAVLQKAVDSKSADAEGAAARLELLFEEAEEFFDNKKWGEPEDWAGDAADHAEHVEDAVEAQDFAKAAEHMKLLFATCNTCHTKYREKAPDGSFTIKKQ
jgi:hypothetical protein